MQSLSSLVYHCIFILINVHQLHTLFYIGLFKTEQCKIRIFENVERCGVSKNRLCLVIEQRYEMKFPHLLASIIILVIY